MILSLLDYQLHYKVLLIALNLFLINQKKTKFIKNLRKNIFEENLCILCSKIPKKVKKAKKLALNRQSYRKFLSICRLQKSQNQDVKS